MSYVKPEQLIDSIVQAGIAKANLSIGQLLARGTPTGAILACATTLAFAATAQTQLGIVGCGFLIFLAGFFLFRMAGLADADDEGALCRFDHVIGDDGEVVDFHHSFELGEEPFQEPEVAARDPRIHSTDGNGGIGRVGVANTNDFDT